MGILIGLAISFAISGLVYLSYEDEIDEARELAEENGIDLNNIDLSGLSNQSPPPVTAQDDAGPVVPPQDGLGDNDPADLAETGLGADPAPMRQTLVEDTPLDPVAFEPEDEQLVVAIENTVDLSAPATNSYDAETDTTTLAFGQMQVLRMLGDQTDVSIGFGTAEETRSGLSPFDIILDPARLANA